VRCDSLTMLFLLRDTSPLSSTCPCCFAPSLCCAVCASLPFLRHCCCGVAHKLQGYVTCCHRMWRPRVHLARMMQLSGWWCTAGFIPNSMLWSATARPEEGMKVHTPVSETCANIPSYSIKVCTSLLVFLITCGEEGIRPRLLGEKSCRGAGQGLLCRSE
jgi:hypothetical protein